MISNAGFLPILDKIAASYRTADLTASQATLTQEAALVVATGDGAFITRLWNSANAQAAVFAPDAQSFANYKQHLQDINGYLQQQGGADFSDLNSYCTYQNGLVRFSALVAPALAYLQWLYVSQAAKTPALLMDAGNVFAPQTTLATVAVGPGAAVETLTAGAGIPTVTDKVSGVQGYTPAPGLTANVTAAIGGTLSITVTGSGVDNTGTPTTNRTWTATLDNAAAGTAVALAPAHAGDRIAAVTGITATGAATAGAFALVSVPERVVS